MKKVFIGIILIVVIALTFIIVTINASQYSLSETPVKETLGPNGEKATPSDDFFLTEDKITKVKDLKLSAAVLLHDTTSDFSKALLRGIEIQSIILGIDIKMIKDCKFDPVKQNEHYIEAIESNIDIIFTLVVDTAMAVETLKLAVDKGVELVFLSNLPNGFIHDKDYASLVTDDLFLMGQYVAEMIIKDLKNQGQVIWFFHDSTYFVTNQRDLAVKTVLEAKNSNIKIVDEVGLSSIDSVSKAVRSSIKSNPGVDAIYLPWDTLAIDAVNVLRDLNRPDIKVYTMDLGLENVEDMLNNGNVKGIVADYPYKLGAVMTCIGGLAGLNISAPPFVTVGATKVDKNNVREKWVEVFSAAFPLE